jgi:hypothetical protein
MRKLGAILPLNPSRLNLTLLLVESSYSKAVEQTSVIKL